MKERSRANQVNVLPTKKYNPKRAHNRTAKREQLALTQSEINDKWTKNHVRKRRAQDGKKLKRETEPTEDTRRVSAGVSGAVVGRGKWWDVTPSESLEPSSQNMNSPQLIISLGWNAGRGK